MTHITTIAHEVRAYPADSSETGSRRSTGSARRRCSVACSWTSSSCWSGSTSYCRACWSYCAWIGRWSPMTIWRIHATRGGAADIRRHRVLIVAWMTIPRQRRENKDPRLRKLWCVFFFLFLFLFLFLPLSLLHVAQGWYPFTPHDSMLDTGKKLRWKGFFDRPWCCYTIPVTSCVRAPLYFLQKWVYIVIMAVGGCGTQYS